MAPTELPTEPSTAQPTEPATDLRAPSADLHDRAPRGRRGVPLRCRRSVHPADEVRAVGGRLGPVDVRRVGGGVRRLAAGLRPLRPTCGWTTSTSIRPRRAPASARRCSTWSRPSGPPASASGSSSPTTRPAGSIARRGLVELERTDGSANEEKAPDIRMAWPGPTRSASTGPSSTTVDARARRAAQPPRRDHRRRPAAQGLGRARPGPRARDRPALALRAPALGEERLYRIVHQIITESLGAAGLFDE